MALLDGRLPRRIIGDVYGPLRRMPDPLWPPPGAPGGGDLTRLPEVWPYRIPVTLGLLSVLVSGLGQVRAMERIARILSERGVPVARVTEPMTGHPDRYVLQFVDPRTLRVYRIAAPMQDPQRLALVSERVGEGLPAVLRYGLPSEIFHQLRLMFGWR